MQGSRREKHGSRCSVSSAAEDGRDEQTTVAATKEDLEQNTADLPVVMQRQVLVIQTAQRTVDVTLLHRRYPIRQDTAKTA